jgi:hypothetical protein
MNGGGVGGQTTTAVPTYTHPLIITCVYSSAASPDMPLCAFLSGQLVQADTWPNLAGSSAGHGSSGSS